MMKKSKGYSIWMIGMIFVFFIGIIRFAVYPTFIHKNEQQETIEHIEPKDEPIKQEKTVEEPKKHVEPITAMIIGVDKSKGLTDVVMTARFDPDTKKVKLISIPRDLWINFEDPIFAPVKEENKNIKIRYCKLTEVFYNAGGDQKAIESIRQIASKVLGTSIDYYAKVDLEGFKGIIDLVEGVEVEIPENIRYHDYSQNLHIDLKEGTQVLDGIHAEQLVRYRGYSNADLGRIQMQQMLLRALGKKVLDVREPKKIIELVKEGYEYIETDFGLLDVISYIQYINEIDVNNLLAEENMVTIPSESKRIDDRWYLIQNVEETKAMVEKLF
jgi:LCP family protein required for cell wall assembly